MRTPLMKIYTASAIVLWSTLMGVALVAGYQGYQSVRGDTTSAIVIGFLALCVMALTIPSKSRKRRH